MIMLVLFLKKRDSRIKKGGSMKKSIMFCMVLVFFGMAVVSAWASGDKMRGDNGQGNVNQNDADSQGNQK